MRRRSNPPDAPIAAFLLPDSFGAAIGSTLATSVSRSLREVITIPAEHHPVQGPQFVYEASPSLFHGRRGRGPLRVAWDTNLLIDYFEHGGSMWEATATPDWSDLAYASELEALQIIIATWVLRDIRFYVLPETITDAKRSLGERRMSQRVTAFREFANAIRVIEAHDDGREAPPLVLPDSALYAALRTVPPGGDRRLIESALRASMHVYLTRDKRLCKAGRAFRSFGLLVSSPLDLLQELVAAGALFCLVDPRWAYWPPPDPERVAHLYRATMATEATLGPLELREIQALPDAAGEPRTSRGTQVGPSLNMGNDAHTSRRGERLPADEVCGHIGQR